MLTNQLRQALPDPIKSRLKKSRQSLGSIREKMFAAVARSFARRNSVSFRRSMELAGFQVARDDDYYSPLPSVTRLKANVSRWRRPSALHGIQFDLEAMKAAFADLLGLYLDEFQGFPPYSKVKEMGFGPGYTEVDALTLYMMIRHLKPRRYTEVGSGVSTYYCSLAAERNARDGFPLEITCIEPYPYEKLSSIPGIHVHAQKVEDVDPQIFRQLQENDVLFIDSSHILRIDGDLPFLFLEVLPLLNVGVVTHIHDIPYPYNVPYPPELWIFSEEWPMFWNEPMLLQAFLAFNEKFKISLSTPLLRHFDEEFLQQRIPFYQTVAQHPNTFSSIWLRRIS